MLKDLGTTEPSSNINYCQVKSIIYFKLSNLKNQHLLFKEMIMMVLFFWLSAYLAETHNINHQQMQGFYQRIVFVYSFIAISHLYHTSLNGTTREILLSIGMNFKNLWIGEWIFNTFYIYISFIVNLSLYLLHLCLFSEVNGNILILYLGAFLYIINLTIWVLTLLAIAKNREIILLSVLNLVILPQYLLSDIFIINYSIKYELVKTILSYILFPVTFSSYYSEIYKQNCSHKYILFLVYQLIFPLILIIFY